MNRRTRILAAAAALTVLLSGCTGVAASVRSASRKADEAAARYRQMLENGRVHDRDGFLLDGENARHDTVFR